MKKRIKKFNHLDSLYKLIELLSGELFSIYGARTFKYKLMSGKSEHSSEVTLIVDAFSTTVSMLLFVHSKHYYLKGEVYKGLNASLLHAASINVHKCYALFASGSTDKDSNLECFDISMDSIYLGKFIKLLLSNKILK